MTLQWFGQSFFKVETKGKVIAIDPFSRDADSGFLKVPKFRADIVLVSHEHKDHNNVSTIEGDPLVFRGPGEYEAKGIFIQGIASFHDNSQGKERGRNTIFVIESEDLRLAHLGDLGQARLAEEQLEAIGAVDILFVPVGGHFTIDGRQAVAVVNQIEPKAVIPMHFKVPGLNLTLETAEKFLKEFASRPKAEEKINIKAKDLLEDKTQLFLLKALSFGSQ